MLELPQAFKVGLLCEDVEDDIPATVNGECCIVKDEKVEWHFGQRVL